MKEIALVASNNSWVDQEVYTFSFKYDYSFKLHIRVIEEVQAEFRDSNAVLVPD